MLKYIVFLIFIILFGVIISYIYHDIKPTKQPKYSLEQYIKLANNTLAKPKYNNDLKQNIAEGFYFGNNYNTIYVITTNGKESFVVNNQTIFQKLTAKNSQDGSKGGYFSPDQDYNLQSFINNVPVGGLVDVFYNTTSDINNVTRINYISSNNK